MYPQYPYPPPPPPPPRRGLSTLTIVLLVVGGCLFLGFGACVVVGGLVYLGVASAEKDAADAGIDLLGTSAEPDPTGAPPPALLDESDDRDDGEEQDDDAKGDDAKDDGRVGAASSGAPAGKAPAAGSGGGTTKWMCNATGSVRVCGFANVCNNMSTSGTGFGSDRQAASTTAKLACEGMIRARGGSGTCSVVCTPRTH